ncbi:hypothetical protein VTL71DRAFT_13028 [Oculimacula yallundae]|uniref:Fungal N-terminal domain-containing protein n=1 Tax=Oculimacula yallundae TaxID=86028 RepID=A0ABR4CP51_9HELO
MAEAIGLAASVAGLIAFTGQIAKTGLFIKGFLSDVKNAPDDIRSLAIEFELLSSAAAKTESMLVKCQRSGIDLDLKDESKVMARYADSIKQLGGRIEKDVVKFGAGGGKWWDRLGSATRKKELAEFLVGMERSKTLMMDVEMRLLINLQHQQNETLAHMPGSVLKVQEGVSSIGPALQNLLQVRASELSALELILDSAIQRGLQRHHREAGNPGITAPSTERNKFGQEKRTDLPIKNCQESPSYAVALVRRDKIVYRSMFRTPLFDIEIETREVQRRPRSDQDSSQTALSKFEPTMSQRFTKYHVRIKIPFWKGGMTYQSGNSGMVYAGNLCKSLRLYNTVPEDAPILQACERLDLAEVQRLFDNSLASPLDCDEHARPLFEIVNYQLLYSTQIDVEKGFELLKFLFCCLGGQVNASDSFHNMMMVAHYSPIPTDLIGQPWLGDLCRLLLRHCSEDPFTGTSEYMNIDISKSAIYSVLCGQQQWLFDNTVTIEFPGFENYFFETDLGILTDPEGCKLQAALSAGLDYAPLLTRNLRSYPAVVDHEGQIHTLLYLAFMGEEDTFRVCVLNRLVILLQHGMDPRRVCQTFLFIGAKYKMPSEQVSCTAFAGLLDLSDLWKSALAKARLDDYEVQDIFNEDQYAGVPELLDGVVEYTSRYEQQKQFIEELRRGIFPEDIDVFHKTLLKACLALEVELGVDCDDLHDLMDEVFSVSRQYTMPGKWNDGEAIDLIPGRDYKLPGKLFGDKKEIKDWECIREIWEIELGGCIPEGCEETEWERRKRIRLEAAKAERKKETVSDYVCTEDEIADEFYDNVTSYENAKSTSNFRSLIEIEADNAIELDFDEDDSELYHDANETQED